MCIIPFSEFCEFDGFYQAYRKTRECKRQKKQVAKFEFHELDALDDIVILVTEQKWLPYPLQSFKIYEPKERDINAPAFADKIIQRHLTDDVVYPALEKSVPFLAFAAQHNKGQHLAVDVMEAQMHDFFLKKKGYMEQERRDAGLPYLPPEEWPYNHGYVLKGDIRKCFKNTNQDLLCKAIFKKIPQKEYQRLLYLYTHQLEEGGVALGHQTSHITVVYFVSQLLRNVCERCNQHRWNMFMDDFYIITETKEEAIECLNECIKAFGSVGYELNEKTNIYTLEHGIDYCGFHVYLTKTGKVIRKLRTSSKKRVKRRIKKWAKDYANGDISKEKIEESFQAWVAHAKHGDTKTLIRNMRKKVNQIYEGDQVNECKH